MPSRARACPACGAGEETGWSEPAATEGLDLPDGDFDYDDFVSREFGGPKPVPRGISWFWWLVAIALLALFLLSMLKRI